MGIRTDPSSACPHDRAGRRAYRPTGRAGSRADRDSFCRSVYCRDCSGGCFWKGCRRCTTPASSPSSATSSTWRTPTPSPPGTRRCATPNGWSTPNRPSAAPRRCWPICARYTHRVAISNHRLVSADADAVAFRWKDYRIKRGDRMKVMRLSTREFIRRFLIHVLPDGFHRIRHYGLLASAGRRRNVETIRQSARRRAARANRDDQTPTRTRRSPSESRALIAAGHANRRNLPARRAPDEPRTATKGRRMMTGPSPSTDPDPDRSPDPQTRIRCAGQFSTAEHSPTRQGPDGRPQVRIIPECRVETIRGRRHPTRCPTTPPTMP